MQPTDRTGTLKRTLYFAGGAIATACLAGTAAAQALDSAAMAEAFREGRGDLLSMRLLRDIFGCRLFESPLTPCDDTAPRAIVEVIIEPINRFLLILGALLLSWNVTAGIAQSAHEGVVLGQRWSSLWAFPRVLVATTMLVPLPAVDGYNAIQAGVGWTVKLSTYVASGIWGLGANLVISGEAVTARLEAQQDPTPVEALWRMMLCRHALERTLRTYRRDREGDWEVFWPLWARPRHDFIQEHFEWSELPVTVKKPNSLHYVFESRMRPEADFRGWSPGDCGVLITPRAPPRVTPEAANAFAQVHWRAINALVGPVGEAARQVVEAVRVNGALPADFEAEFDLPGKITAWMQLHRSTLAPNLNTAFDWAYGGDVKRARNLLATIISGSTASVCADGTDDLAVRAACRTDEGQGWLMAGSYYLHLARFNDNRLSFMEAKPDARHMLASDLKNVLGESWWEKVGAALPRRLGGNPDAAALRSQAGREVNHAIGEGINLWNHAVPTLAAQGVAVPEHVVENLHGETAGDGGFFDMKRAMSKLLLRWLGEERLSGDPIISIIQFGNGLTAAFGGLSLGAGAAAGIPVIGPALDAALGLLFPLALAGAFLSTLLPMLPYIFWILAVTGYLLRVAEAFIAVNLWAIGHMRMDGEGLAGDGGRPGYFIMLNLMMQPTLMVVAFLISMTIFKVTAILLNLGAYTAIDALNFGNSSAVWLFQMICVLGMLVVTYAVLAERSFSLIYELPDRVMRWIGADIPGAGGEEYGYAKAGGLAVSGAATPVAGAVGKGTGRGLIGAIRRGRRGWLRPWIGPPNSGK